MSDVQNRWKRLPKRKGIGERLVSRRPAEPSTRGEPQYEFLPGLLVALHRWMALLTGPQSEFLLCLLVALHRWMAALTGSAQMDGPINRMWFARGTCQTLRFSAASVSLRFAL